MSESLTIRKIKRRGYVPVRFHYERGHVCEFRHGFIMKRTPKYITLFLIGIGRRRVPVAEERYITVIDRNGRHNQTVH